MNKKKYSVPLKIWGLRIILFSVLAYALYDFGADEGPSLLGAIMFMAFWMWYFWIDQDD